MNQRKTLIIGVIFLLLGCIASLYLALKIANAQIKGIFTIASDAPTNTFQNFQCPLPLFLNINETASVSATILNPISDTLNYSVHIEADGFVISPAEHELDVTIPGNQTTEVAWVVTATKGGEQTIAIEATSTKDLALPGLGHPWPTSFREGCGILVIDGPLTGHQILFLGLTSALIGAVLLFLWLYAKVRRWLSGRRQAYSGGSAAGHSAGARGARAAEWLDEADTDLFVRGCGLSRAPFAMTDKTFGGGDNG